MISLSCTSTFRLSIRSRYDPPKIIPVYIGEESYIQIMKESKNPSPRINFYGMSV